MDASAKRCFVFDLDGTVYLGDRPIQPTVDFVRRNLGQREIYFLSNNTSRNPADYVAKLAGFGIDADIGQILSPLVPLVEYLEAEGISRIYPVGNASFRGYLQDRMSDLVFGAGEDCQAVVLAYDTELTYEKLETSCLLLQRPEVRFLATHPDRVCPSPLGPLPDVGSFIKLYEEATGRLPERIFGKPDPAILAPLMRRFRAEEMVMVGDRLSTDMKLAENAGIDFILVLSGEAKREDLRDHAYQPWLVLDHLGAL